MKIPGCMTALSVFLIAGLHASADYDEELDRGIRQCAAIDPDAVQSGLWLNPEGYQAYYEQSACYQQLAIRMRQADLCDEVRRKWAIFSSTWGYSESNCHKLVAAGVASDLANINGLKSRYESGPVRLLDFRVEKNGNGRDYDIIPVYSDSGMASGYELEIHFIVAGERFLLTRHGNYLSGRENIRLFEYRRDIASRFPAFQPGAHYELEASLTLAIGTGPQNGRWSPAFIKGHFPPEQRRQTLRKQIAMPP